MNKEIALDRVMFWLGKEKGNLKISEQTEDIFSLTTKEGRVINLYPKKEVVEWVGHGNVYTFATSFETFLSSDKREGSKDNIL